MKSVEILHELGVINTHDLLTRYVTDGKLVEQKVRKRRAIACVYLRGVSREMSLDHTYVYSPYFETNPDAAWFDRKKKAFRGSIKKSMPKALAWAKETYGIEKWATDPTDRSTRVPAEVRFFADQLVAEYKKNAKHYDDKKNAKHYDGSCCNCGEHCETGWDVCTRGCS